MARDDKLVRASLKSKQSIERVLWVWCAILESAAEIDDGGRYEIDHAEMARFLRCSEGKLAAIEDALRDLGRLHESTVAKWNGRQFQSDRSAERTKRYRDGLKGKNCAGDKTSRDDNVTSQERHCDAPETETETETETEEVPIDKSIGALPDSDSVFWANSKAYLADVSKNPGALIGMWVQKHGKLETADALTRAQLDRPVEKIPFIQGCFRHSKRQSAEEFASPC
jgi:hypothetical protein